MKNLLRRFYYFRKRRERIRRDADRRATMISILTTLGNVSIMWSGISLLLNSFIEWNQDRLGQQLPRGLPRHFTSKLEHLKKVEKDDLWSEEQRKEMRAIRLELGRLNNTRIELVHGFVFMTGLTEDFEIHIVKEQGNQLMRKTIERSYAELRQFRDGLFRMIVQLTDLYDPIMGIHHEG